MGKPSNLHFRPRLCPVESLPDYWVEPTSGLRSLLLGTSSASRRTNRPESYHCCKRWTRSDVERSRVLWDASILMKKKNDLHFDDTWIVKCLDLWWFKMSTLLLKLYTIITICNEILRNWFKVNLLDQPLFRKLNF